MSEFDVNGYNSHECDIHNHGYYLGAQSQQAKIDELQGRIDDASNKIDFWVGGKNGDAIHVAKSIGNILKGNKDEN